MYLILILVLSGKVLIVIYLIWLVCSLLVRLVFRYLCFVGFDVFLVCCVYFVYFGKVVYVCEEDVDFDDIVEVGVCGFEDGL